MMTTDHPGHPDHLDEASVRGELTRVFDHCRDCRRCIDRCATFPMLFDMLDRLGVDDAGLLTPAQQDRVVDSCFHCAWCSSDCPYTPERHEARIDFPRLMLRATAMQRQQRLTTSRSRLTTALLGRADLVGALASAWAPLANRIVGARPGSLVRRVVASVSGLSARRVVAAFARQRFSAWFAQRPNVVLGDRQGRITIYPTCVVEYQAPSIGKDLVLVAERNGLECACSAARCCGAPSLQAGDLRRFRRIAERNVATLAGEVRDGTDIVVLQPTCADVIRRHYVDHVGDARRADAELVAAHTLDPQECLMRVHDADDGVLDTAFTGPVGGNITYHVAGPVRAGTEARRGRDLLMLTGATVTLVEQGAGGGAMWALRADHEAVAVPAAERLAARIEAAAVGTIVGECHVTNVEIAGRTGRRPLHPVEALALAYGVHDPP